MSTGKIDSISYIMLVGIFFMSLSKAVPLLPYVPDVIYYGSFLGILSWFILREGVRLSYSYIPFLIIIFISIWVNEIPAYFRVWSRVMAFVVIIFAVGPFFIKPMMQTWRHLLFVYALVSVRWIVIASFIGWLFQVSYIYGYSGFHGFTNQSMLLGPLGGISFIYGLYRFYLSSNKMSRYKETIFAVISMVVVLLTGSRSALAATLIGALFFYSRVYRHHLMRMGRLGLSVLCVAILTSGIWWSYTERLRIKMDNSKNLGSLTTTRDKLWEDRISEFNAFPLFGVGFASVNLKYARNAADKVDQESGVVEPGSGWLFLLSSMGGIGFLAFFIPYVHWGYIFFKKESVGLNGYFLGALLSLFFVHLIFEGYLMASGAYLCVFLWLLLSECNKVVNLSN